MSRPVSGVTHRHGNTLLLVSALLSVALAIAAFTGLENLTGISQKLSRLALYLAPLPFALVLSLRFPVQPLTARVAANIFQDAGFFVLMIAFRIAFTAVFITWVANVYAAHFDYLTWRPGQNWPVAVRVILALLISDLLAWFHHYVRHRVQPFWEFHKLHHSQTYLNFFTDFRVHPVDYVIANLIIVIPQLLVQVDTPTIILLGIAIQWHTTLYHCSIRTNYGPLRFLLVNPQSHRVHHSTCPEHHGKNFGVIFSIWDRLLGTQYRDENVYPVSGVEPEFPVERSLAEVVSMRPLYRQLIYPFSRIWKRGP